MHNKKGFSLLELSIMVIIVAIVVSVVLQSQVLITRAKINNIYNDFVGIKKGFLNFRLNELCLPGECDANYLQKQGFSAGYYAAASASGGCGNGNGTFAFNGLIDTTVKRSCAFSQLQMRGYLQPNAVLNIPVNTAASLAGGNIPFSNFSDLASWDLRYAAVTNLYPIELSVNLGTLPPSSTSASFVSSWVGSYALVLRNAVVSSSVNVADDDIVSPPSNTANGAISSYLANLIDKKFDDGKPLTGSIIAGVNNGVTPNVSGSSGCYNLSSGGTFKTITALEKYAGSKSSNLQNGCILAFQISFTDV